MPRGSAPSLTEQRKRLEAKLRAIKAKEQEEAARRFTVAGRALLDHAAGDPAFQRQVDHILGQQLKKQRDRALFDLDGKGETPSAPEAPPTAGSSSPSSR